MSELMKWLSDYQDNSLTDENEQLLDQFNCFKNYLDVPKDNAVFLENDTNIKNIRWACFVRDLWYHINLQDDINVVMWVSSNMTCTTNNGHWTKTIYQQNEQKVLKAIREIVEYLKIPDEQVLFLVPGDSNQQEKIGNFVSNILDQYDEDNYTAMVWFKCEDNYDLHVAKQMLL